MGSLLVQILNLVVIVFFVRAIVSWFRPSPDSAIYPVVEVLFKITEPVLAPIRKVLPAMGGIDLSVLVVIFGIRLILIPLVRNL